MANRIVRARLGTLVDNASDGFPRCFDAAVLIDAVLDEIAFHACFEFRLIRVANASYVQPAIPFEIGIQGGKVADPILFPIAPPQDHLGRASGAIQF